MMDKKRGYIMGEDREYIFSGFCRTFNQSQTVTCEVVCENNHIILESVDCAYYRCLHKGSCEVARQIGEVLNEVRMS